jgi:cbb3-type cytochrome oxidase subunit 3
MSLVLASDASSIPATLSLLFFFGLFLAIILWVAVGNRNGRFTRDARIPLEDEPVEPLAPRASARASAKEHPHV